MAEQVFVLKVSISNRMDFADDPLLFKCFLHLSPLPVHNTNPTDYQWIFTEQNKTNELLKNQKNSWKIFQKILDNKENVCYALLDDD